MPSPDDRVDRGVFVGRVPELARLRAAGLEALAGRPAAVLVEGPGGIGRSALLREFDRRSAGFRTIALTAFPDEAALPYGLISQLALALRASGHDPDWARITTEGDPVAVGMALLEALSKVAGESPVLVLVDDLHHADPESALVLRFVLRRLVADRICLVGTVNPWAAASVAVPNVLPAIGDGGTVELYGLDPDDLGRLVDLRLGRMDHTLVARLAAWTSGNPTLVWAVLGDEKWLDGTPAGRPSSLAGALRSVIADLPPASRSLLGALSILHNPVDRPTLRAVAGVDGAGDDPVEPLLAARLVRVPDGLPEGLEFVDPTLREATAQTLDEATRRRLHDAASAVATGPAERLEHLVAARSGPDAGLARSLCAEGEAELGAGNLLPAAQYFRQAAEAAADEPERASMLTRAIRLFVQVGRGSIAMQLAPRVEAMSRSWERDEALGLIAFSRGEPATALQHLIVAQAAASDLVPAEERARVAVEIAVVAVTLFAGEQAQRASRQARALTAQPEVDRLAAATGAFGRAMTAGPLAALTDLDYLPDAPALCAEQDLTALTFRGILRGVVGRFDEAIADLTVAARRREATRVAVFGVTAHIHLAWCQWMVGLWEAATQTIAVAIELADVYGRPFDHAALRSSAAVGRALHGEPEAARRELAEADRLSARSDFLGPAFHLTLSRAAIAWSQGNFRDVVTELEPLRARPTDPQRVDLFALWWLPMLADAQLITGRHQDAARTVDRLAAIDAVPGSMRDTAVAWLRSRLARKTGDVAGALRILSAAVTGPDFTTRRNPYTGAVLQALGDAQHATGDQAAARRSFDSAIGTLEAMGITPLAVRCRDRMTRLFAEPAPPPRLAVLDKLTEKEGQVAALIGRGWTNPEIAKTLFVSTKTVEYHLRNIYIKLDLQSRRQLRDLLQAPAA